ncbi:MAG TPA: tetratricopeptide repeat protein [Nitrosopumilaceae archaeon]|nr:tetratricopeptide repeat protein [Nitrosopumilaceae archaeon]
MIKKSIFFVIFTILIFSLNSNFALAEEEQDEPIGDIIISTDKPAYVPEETIVISGEITKRKMPLIAIKVFDPEDNILGGYNVELDENNYFSKTVKADIPFYEKPGIYTVIAEYGKIKSEIIFEIENDLFVEEEILEAEDILESDEILVEEVKPQITLFKTDKETYQDGDLISITGKVSKNSLPQVTITIFDQFDIPTGIYLATVNPDLTFSTSFLAKYNTNFKVIGQYTVTAQYGELETKQILTIEFVEKGSLSESTGSAPEIEEPTTDSFLFSESDLQHLASWYYLGSTDDDLVLFFEDLAKKDLLNSDTNTVISKNLLSKWIRANNLPIGSMISDLFEGNISEERFILLIENSLNDYIDTSSNTVSPPQQKPISEIKKPENTNPKKSEDTPTEAKNELPLEPEEEKITYFYSNVNCEKKTYEDVISQYNSPGPALAHLCKYEDAILHYERTLEHEPENIHALTNTGSALANLGRYDDALLYYDKVLEIDPNNLAALHNKGNVLADLGNFQEAISYYDQVLKTNPHYLPTLENREKASTSLTVFTTNEEPHMQSISHHVTEDNEQDSISETNSDIVKQFASALSSIGTSLLALFGG